MRICPCSEQRNNLITSLAGLDAADRALVVVGLAVSGTVRNALAQLSLHEWELHPVWLVAAGAFYVMGLLAMGWFWHRALAALGCPTPRLVSLRAYFLGHLGKYVPGKAMATILRVAAVRRWVPSMRLALVSVLLETLTMMAVGACLATAISIAVLRLETTRACVISLTALAMALAAGVPTLPPVARWLARLGVGRFQRDDEANRQTLTSAEIEMNLRGIQFRLLAAGWVAATFCWMLLGLSLWSTLRAIGIDQFGMVTDLPILVAAVAFAVVAGFISMLPGGLVVRDALLMQLLAPVCGEANALIAAVLMRLVWLVSEVVVCGILYVGVRGSVQRVARSEK